MKKLNEVINTATIGIWRHRCPNCGEGCECTGEQATYNGKTAELIEWYECKKCQLQFDVVSEIRYKYHVIYEEEVE